MSSDPAKTSFTKAAADVTQAHKDHAEAIGRAADAAPTHQAFVASRKRAHDVLDRANDTFASAVRNRDGK
jgi:hypothetical protein